MVGYITLYQEALCKQTRNSPPVPFGSQYSDLPQGSPDVHTSDMIQPPSSSINQFLDDDDEIDNRPYDALNDNGLNSDDESISHVHISRFRSTLPQVLATTAQSLLLLSLGMMVSAPTVVIGALLNTTTESFSINNSQASWFAGILLICQPLGSILSGFLQEWMGRKRCMLLVNIPELIAWYLIFSSKGVTELYVAACLMGLTIGFMEAPTLSYVGEISQPHLRGTLASFTSTYISFGFFLMYLLGTLTKWRTAILISCSAPVTTFIAITMIPESPIWLINKNRLEDAEKAMCWLRGWVSPPLIRKELEALIQYCEASKLKSTPVLINQYTAVNSNDGILVHQSKIKMYFKDLTRSEMIKPIKLVITYFFFYHCTSLSGLRPYMVKVFGSLQLPVTSRMMTVISALLQLSGGFGCMILVHRTGKRVLSLISMSCCAILCICLGIYTYQTRIFQPWIPFGLFCCLFFFTNLGISPIPWSLLAEVFPSRGRGVGGGICAAFYYLEFFLVSKTFLDLQVLVQLDGVFFLYGGLGLLGIVYIYFCLPETEGKKLEDIEKIFSDSRT